LLVVPYRGARKTIKGLIMKRVTVQIGLKVYGGILKAYNPLDQDALTEI
jgi:hypothetical protein